MLAHTEILFWRGLFLAALLATIFVGALVVRLLRWLRARPTATNSRPIGRPGSPRHSATA